MKHFSNMNFREHLGVDGFVSWIYYEVKSFVNLIPNAPLSLLKQVKLQRGVVLNFLFSTKYYILLYWPRVIHFFVHLVLRCTKIELKLTKVSKLFTQNHLILYQLFQTIVSLSNIPPISISQNETKVGKNIGAWDRY